MAYDESEHTRALAISKMALDLHIVIQEYAKLADNPSVEKALNEAADALDIWLQDEFTSNVMKVIEDMEYDAGVSEFLREARIMESSYGRR